MDGRRERVRQADHSPPVKDETVPVAAPARRTSDPQQLLALQRSAGNVTVTRYLQRLRAGDAPPRVDAHLGVARQPGKPKAKADKKGGGVLGAIRDAAAEAWRRVKALAKRIAKQLARGGAGNGGSLSSRIDTAYHYYRNVGLTRAQAAGLVGNLQEESGGQLNPAQKQFGGGPGRGIGQWTIGDSRWKDLLAFAKKRNRPWSDYETQVAFVWHELNTYSYFGLGALKRAKTVRDATKIVMEQYERPGIEHFDIRLGNANAIHKRFGD
jgi:Phage tail lysozyme